MAGRGYDDEGHIAAVESLMATEPGLSRRAAILRVAGEGSLRRIEMKMQRRSEASEGMLEWPAAGLEGDADAFRLAQGEAALPLAAGERKIWSGRNSRSACALDAIAASHPRFALVERVHVWGAALCFGSLFLMLGVLVAATTAFFFLPWTRSLGGVAGWTILATFALSLVGGAVHMPLGFWIMDVRFGAVEGMRDRLRRYVVTDRSVYVISLREGGVAWRRLSYGSLVGTDVVADGCVRLRGSAGEVCLAMLADAAGLVRAVGGRQEGMPAPVDTFRVRPS